MDKKMALVSVLMIVPSTFLFVLAYFTFFGKNEKQKILHRTPPGYKVLPFFGESFSFLKTYSQNSVGEFIQHRLSRFENIFSTNIFGSLSVISANSKFNRLVMNNDVLFAHGITPSVKKIVGENSLGLAVGDVHKHMRSTVLNFLSGERLRTIFFQDTYSLSSKVISLWKDVDVISIKDEAFKFSLCIMAKRLLSMRGPDIETLEAKYDSVTKAFKAYPLDIPGTRFNTDLTAMIEHGKNEDYQTHVVNFVWNNGSESHHDSNNTQQVQDQQEQVIVDGLMKKKCRLLSWKKNVVTEGTIASTDPDASVHFVKLGAEAWKVWVDVAVEPEAFLFRPNSEMSTIKEAVRSTVAWHKDFISLV